VELREAPCGVRKEHQPQAAQHRVKALIGEGKRLPVLDCNDGVWGAAKAIARPPDHRARDVGRDDRARQANGGEGSLGCQPRAGGHVEHAHAQPDAGRAQQKGDEVSRHRANEAVVPGGGCVVELEFGHRSGSLLPAAVYIGPKPPGSNLIVGPDQLVS